MNIEEVTVRKVVLDSGERYTVPDWAKFVTISTNGVVCAWRYEPYLENGKWFSHNDSFVKAIGASRTIRNAPDIIELDPFFY